MGLLIFHLPPVVATKWNEAALAAGVSVKLLDAPPYPELEAPNHRELARDSCYEYEVSRASGSCIFWVYLEIINEQPYWSAQFVVGEMMPPLCRMFAASGALPNMMFGYHCDRLYRGTPQAVAAWCNDFLPITALPHCFCNTPAHMPFEDVPMPTARNTGKPSCIVHLGPAIDPETGSLAVHMGFSLHGVLPRLFKHVQRTPAERAIESFGIRQVVRQRWRDPRIA
jgi:hypothetical protein